MAKSLLQMRSKKKPRISRSEAYMVNLKYLGEEPAAPTTEVERAKAFNWYNNMCSREEARQYLKDYFKGDAEMTRAVTRIPDKWVPMTSAWVCRMATNAKQKLDSASADRVAKSIAYALGQRGDEDDDESPVETKTKPSIQERMKDRLSDIIGDIEEMVDAGSDLQLYDWLKAKEVPATYAARIADYYRPIETEMRLALIPKGQDGSIDGYENWTKAQIRARAEFYGRLVSDAERYGDVTKKVRKPRKPRPVSVDKLLKHLRYQKESNEFKLASVSPESIVGAQELWTFNTKYKVLTVFRALDRAGLTVKRSSIANYDEKTSASKGAGRSAEKVVDKIKNGGKIVLRKAMEELKSAKPLQERINENTILLRVIK